MDGILVDATSLRTSITGVASVVTTPETDLQAVSSWLDALQSAQKPATGWLAADPPQKLVVQLSLAISLLRQTARNGHVWSPEDIGYVWYMIRRAVLGLTLKVSRSSQGFLVVPLCSLITGGRIKELWRFHVWLPDGHRGNLDVSVHAHQPLGQSWTLAGEAVDVRFTTRAGATHAVYELAWSDAQGTSRAYKTDMLSSTVQNTGKTLHLEEASRTTYRRDDVYTVPAGEYHRSVVAGDAFHATLFVFDAARGYEHDAAVLGPVDGVSFTEVREPVEVTAAELVEMVEAARRREVETAVRDKSGDQHGCSR